MPLEVDPSGPKELDSEVSGASYNSLPSPDGLSSRGSGRDTDGCQQGNSSMHQMCHHMHWNRGDDAPSETSCTSEQTHPKSLPALTPPSSPAPRRRRRRRNVSFGDVTVREYKTTLSDHPACTDGPPIGLDWPYNQKSATDVDTYEADKLVCNDRRTLNQLRMSETKRRNMLLRQGHTEEEIMTVMKDIKRTQIQRKKNMQAFLPPGASIKIEVAAKKIALVVDKGNMVKIEQAARKVVDIVDRATVVE